MRQKNQIELNSRTERRVKPKAAPPRDRSKRGEGKPGTPARADE
jgi:hypothetical protein